MRILLINHYAGSPYMGMEFRPYYMAAEWVKAGHEVTILAADHSHLRLSNPKISRNFEEQDIDGITYCFVSTPDYDKSLSGRSRNVLAFVRKLYFEAEMLAKKYKPEVVIASSTYPFDSFAAHRIAKYTSAPVIFEVHDLWPLTQIELYGYKPNHPMVLTLAYAQRQAVTKSEAVVSIIPFADRYFKQNELTVKEYVHIPNGIRVKRKSVPPPQQHLQLIRHKRNKGRFIVLYCGSIGPSNALDELVKAAKQLEDRVAVVIIGNGGYKITLKRIAREHCINNLLFLDGVQRDQLPGLMELADCLYIGAKDSPLYRYGVGMNKIYDYMLAGKPILAAMAAANDPVAEAGCGITVPPGNPDEIAQGIRRMMEFSPEERHNMGKRGCDYVTANHDYKVLADKFMTVLEGAVARHAQQLKGQGGQ